LSGITRSGEPYVELTPAVILTFVPRGAFILPSDMFFVWQNRWEELGDPIEGPHDDGFAYYANFRFGHISRTPGGQPRAVIGRTYRHARYAGGPCADHNRPCLVSARREGTTIRIAWHWGTADAFNVGWQLERGNGDGHEVEVAGYDYVIRDVYPFESYIVHLQACNKRFLQASICTPTTDYLVP
jgi:hypothetical protein